MKIGDFPLVETLIDCRNRLIHQKDHGRIVIEVDRNHMAPDFVEAVAPAVKLELRNRIEEIDLQLRGLGIVLD
jgi:hypothetical protein